MQLVSQGGDESSIVRILGILGGFNDSFPIDCRVASRHLGGTRYVGSECSHHRVVMPSRSPPASNRKIPKRMCFFGAVDGITSSSDDIVKLCLMIPKSESAGHLPRPALCVESREVMNFQQLGEVECIRGSILGEPACAMTYIRGGRLSLHIQVPPKDEELCMQLSSFFQRQHVCQEPFCPYDSRHVDMH